MKKKIDWKIKLNDMLKVKIHFVNKQNINFKMRDYLFNINLKSKIYILDITKIASLLTIACNLLFYAAKNKKTFLILSQQKNKKEIKPIIIKTNNFLTKMFLITNKKVRNNLKKKLILKRKNKKINNKYNTLKLTYLKFISEKIRCHYITRNIRAGLLTNWLTTKIKLKNLLISKKKTKIISFYNNLEGIRYMTKRPDIVILIDPQNDIIIRECFTLKIATICLININTDINIDLSDIVIPINTLNLPSINFILNKLSYAILTGCYQKN
uniref:ribosomal protein S2 n=1 Tax=Prosopanche panguanensis TaxID=2952649 RepID=UPI0021140CBE|nr:ribosomal protein S2 [Prosopanche panguanensis]USN93715.1 ribosomal protein S2 [Prosopanche panguanensis]